MGALLLGYWALLAMTGGYEPLHNLGSRVDAAMLGRYAYQFDPATGLGHEPEGLLSTLPAIATTLIGVRAGAWLRDHGSTRLLLTAMVALVLGLAWSQLLPLNKQLWTSSFVVYAAGWSLLLLALCHDVFDLRNAPALGRSMGLNAISAYAGSWLLACLLSGTGLLRPLYQHLFASWVTPAFGPHAASLAYAVAFVALWWWLMWGMQRKGIRISI